MTVSGTPYLRHKAAVIARCDLFDLIGLWPGSSKLDPEGWLSNFDDRDDLDYALALLEGFTYYNPELTLSNLAAAIRKLGRAFSDRTNTGACWAAFLATSVVTPVVGEHDDFASSGPTLSRLVAVTLNIVERRQLVPLPAIIQAAENGIQQNVLFVDDFAGSGDQFIHTLQRDVDLDLQNLGLRRRRLEHYLGLPTLRVYYCPAYATQHCLDRLAKEFPAVTVSPGGVLSSRHDATDLTSSFWPDELRAGAIEFIDTTNRRAGITEHPYGFKKLGLAIAVNDNIPDASLPLFYHKENGWKPLFSRSV